MKPILRILAGLLFLPLQAFAVLEQEDPISRISLSLACYQSLNAYPGGNGPTITSGGSSLTAIPTEPEPDPAEADGALTYVTQPEVNPEAFLFRETREGERSRLEIYRVRVPEGTQPLAPTDDILRLAQRHYLLKVDFTRATRLENVPLTEWTERGRLADALPAYLDLERSVLGLRSDVRARPVNPYAPRIGLLTYPGAEVPPLESPELYTAVSAERVTVDRQVEVFLLEAVMRQLERIIAAELSDTDRGMAPELERQRQETLGAAFAACESAGLGPSLEALRRDGDGTTHGSERTSAPGIPGLGY